MTRGIVKCRLQDVNITLAHAIIGHQLVAVHGLCCAHRGPMIVRVPCFETVVCTGIRSDADTVRPQAINESKVIVKGQAIRSCMASDEQ